MCWSIEVSLGSALFGWAACLFLKFRGGPRDDFYARYLVTFTGTQIVDIALWALHKRTEAYGDTYGGLQACPDLQLQFWRLPPSDHPQFTNFLISKLLLPMVVFSQHAMQLTYPSSCSNAPGQRKNMILWRIFPCFIMAFAFACTWLVPSPYDHSHTQGADNEKFITFNGTRTLHWGGDFTHHRMKEYLGFFMIPSTELMTLVIIQVAACMHSGLVAYDFCAVMPPRMALMHNLVLAGVVGTLAATEGTIQLGSKWCAYCLIYSVVYCLDPLWYPLLCAEDDKEESSAPATPSVLTTPTRLPKTPTSPSTPPDTGYRGTGRQLRYRGPRSSPGA